MRVRLGFSIATAIKPDVLLLDEVFIVGDIVFRQRCFERIQELKEDTVIFLTSHQAMFVEMMCNRALWLDKGKAVADGDVDEVTALYAEETSRQSALFAMTTGASRRGNGDVRFTESVRVYGSKSGTDEVAIRGENLIVEAAFTCQKPWSQVTFSIELLNLATGMPMTTADCEVPEVTADGTLRCTFYTLPLMPHSYAISLKIAHGEIALDNWRNAASFTVKRLAAMPSKKVQKYPHEITVETGGASYLHSHQAPKTTETTA